MYIKKISISNYKIFKSDDEFVIDGINIPDGINDGSGLSVFVGENASGKTTLLEAFALPILEFKSDGFSVNDLNDPSKGSDICIYADKDFSVSGTMPNSSFLASGFQFRAAMRSRENKAYLSTILVTDQLFIKSNQSSKPKDGSPDLRLNVNNPFVGKRFNDNDVILLDRNRLYQTRSGSFNTTRFDRLMEDFSHQYLKSIGNVINLNDDLNEKIKKDKIENKFLEDAINKFKDISGQQIRLDFIDNFKPFNNAFFTNKKDNHQQIELSSLGSGYEMIFALLYSFFLAKQSGKQLIILIDEPELHLHPRLQEKFMEFLIEISKESQVILTTHSPLLIKQLASNDYVKIMIIKDGNEVLSPVERKLSYVSANETNFIAFNLATEEYHNELFEELKYINAPSKDIKPFDNDFFVAQKGEPKDCPWKSYPNEVSKHTYIRNQIHHQRDNGKVDYCDLKSSIEKMRTFF